MAERDLKGLKFEIGGTASEDVYVPIDEEARAKADRSVKTVNGKEPDENGNVDVEGGGGESGKDGVGIKSVIQTTTSTESGGENIVTVTKTDNTSSTFSFRNGQRGEKGDKGDSGYTPQKNVDYFDGNDYVLTEADKTEIADITKSKIDLSSYVEKENGKGLSSNDFTNDDKTKLDGLENYDDTQIKQDITALETKVNNIHGFDIVPLGEGQYTISGVPVVENPKTNTLYLVPSSEEEPNLFIEWLWVNSKWEKFGSATVDLTNYVTQTELETETSKKQDALVSGTNIKTINGNSILGNGNIEISGGGSGVTEQTVADWGFTKNTGNYDKPETGIPETDLSEAVKAKLNSNNGITWRIENGILYADYEESGGIE